jgi:hypothetical protein
LTAAWEWTRENRGGAGDESKQILGLALTKIAIAIRDETDRLVRVAA